MRRCHLFRICEELLHVHVQLVTGADLVSWRVVDCFIYFGFSNLLFSPVREKGLRISRPAFIATSGVMVAVLRERG
jgi:hypothetical protein